MALRLWWIVPFMGLISWIALFGAIVHKNLEVTLWHSIFKPRNEMVQVSLVICLLSILNNLLWLAMGKGIIINIFQQAVVLAFQMTVLQYGLKVFDPMQRVVSSRVMKRNCGILKLVLGLCTIILAILIRVKEIYGIASLESYYDHIVFYFLVIDFFIGLFICFAIYVFSGIYVSVRRGLAFDSSEEKEPEVLDLRQRWMIEPVDISSFGAEEDPHCIHTLKLEKILLERLLFYFLLVLSMNVYKLSWGSSQYECSARVSCTPSVTEKFFQRLINSLSYWMPDIIYMVAWYLLLFKPVSNVVLPQESNKQTYDANELLNKHREVSADITEKLSFDSDSISTGIKLSLISNPMSPSRHESEISSNGNLQNGQHVEQNVTKMHEVREIAISCEELILFHRESGIPHASLFSGHDTFAVLCMQTFETIDKEKSCGEAVAVSPWVELGRSDCRQNTANPYFHAAFIVPDIQNKNVLYKIDMYNVEDDSDSSFHPNNADLPAQTLISSVFLSQSELSDLTDSDNEHCNVYVPGKENTALGSLALYRSKCIERGILLPKAPVKFSEIYIGIGGKMHISARKVRPVVQQLGEIHKINGLPLSTMHNADMARENNPRINDALMRSFITKTFGHGIECFDVNLREELVESQYSFDVPSAFLRSLIPERVMELETIIEKLGWDDSMIDLSSPSGDKLDSAEWSSEFIRSISANIEGMRNAVHFYAESTVSFKPSREKKNKDLEYIPINLHVHVFEMSSQHKEESYSIANCNDYDKQYICDFITVGAFSAHAKKFKQGGLWHLMMQIEHRLQEIAPGCLTPSSDTDFLMPHEIWNINVLRKLPQDPLLLHLAFKARERFDICVSQCLASVAAGFLSRVQLMSPAVVKRMVTVGLLFQFESLLSTQGHELGMLSDFFCAIKFLDFVQVRVFEMPESDSSGKQTAVRIYREHDLFILDLGYVPKIFQSLPELIRQGCGVAVVPVMFTVGVNEFQTYAETMVGKKAFHLQDLINRESLSRIEEYHMLVKRYESGELDNDAAMIRDSFLSEKRKSSTSTSGERKRTSLNNSSVEPSFVEDITKPLSDGSTLWLQSPASCQRKLHFSKDSIDLPRESSVRCNWGDMEKAIGGFSLWNGTKKKTSDKGGSKSDLSGESKDYHEFDDDVDHADIHKHLFNLAKESFDRESSSHDNDSLTLSHQVNPMASDIETGQVDGDKEAYRTRSVSRAKSVKNAPLWCFDDEKEYERELELELGFFEGSLSRQSAFREVGSVSEAIQGSRVSLVGVESVGGDIQPEVNDDRLQRLVSRLSNHVKKSQGVGGKPFQILTDAAKLTRGMDGVRMTSCKSAKDRTGMSVTLEQVQLAQEIFGLSAFEAKNILIAMRQHGVRLANTEKNVGKACFSFNRFQRKFLPAVYQPPINVMGKVDS